MPEVKVMNSGFAGNLLVAVSGGIDSMTLADMLYASKRQFSIAHCNFHLRGEDSDGDAAFVSEWAAARGLKCHRADFDTSSYAKEHSLSIEMAARELRYAFFARLCREYGYSCVVVAHNANDNAETLILNLVRGCGLKGICGMKEYSYMDVDCTGISGEDISGAYATDADNSGRWRLKIWRPLLTMSRRQIEGYAFTNSVKWREDRTNSSSEYRRNLIRNEVLPLLERLNPSVIRTLNADMDNFRDAAALVESLSSGQNVRRVDDRTVEISFNTAKHWRHRLFCDLEAQAVPPAVISQIVDLVGSGRTVSGKRFYCNGKNLVMTSGTVLVQDAVAAESGPDSVIVEGPGEYSLKGVRFRVEAFEKPEGFSFVRPQGESVADAASLPFPFVVRSWRHGDWMRPLGVRGKKKISDMFTDLGFNLLQKEAALLAAMEGDGSEVMVLVGCRVSESVKLSHSTEQCVRIAII